MTSDSGTASVLGLETVKGQNIILLSKADLKTRLERSNPALKKIEISKKYPRSLDIYVESDSPTAAVAADRGYLILNSEGKIITKTEKKPDDLVEILYYQKLNRALFETGDRLEYEDLLQALAIFKKITDIGLNPDTIDINGVDMIAFKQDKRRIIFSSEKSIERQYHEMEIIIKEFKVQGKEFRELDLRFDRPVVKF